RLWTKLESLKLGRVSSGADSREDIGMDRWHRAAWATRALVRWAGQPEAQTPRIILSRRDAPDAVSVAEGGEGPSAALVSRVLDPHGGNPHDLTVVLLAPHVVVAGFILVGLVIPPGEIHVLRIRRGRVYKLAVADQRHLGKFGGSVQPDFQSGRIGGGELVA